MAATSNSTTKASNAKTVLDLTTSVLNASNSSNPLVNGAIEVGQWLGREKLNRDELGDCLAKAKSLAQPNELGLRFCNEVKEGELQNPVPHVFLKQSGALGRMMVRDPWLCWIVTTTASLFQFHSDAGFISDAICTFIMRHHEPPEARHDEWSFRYRPDRVQTNFILNRIVLSVWWNVVNAGHKTIDLPEGLRGICPRGHLLSSNNLGKVMHALQRRAPRVILQSQHLLANIALWLVLHHDGLLRVVVSGKTVYEKQQGSLLREVELRIARFCPNNGPCVEDDILPYEVLEDLKGKRQTLHSGTYEPASSLHHNPSVRQPLYNIPRLYPSESRATKSSIRVLVQHTAQSMVQWLLRVPLLPQVDFATFGFQAAPGEVFDSPKLSVTDILSQIPSIVNMKWGTAASGSVVYNSIKEEDELASGHDSDTTMDDFDPGLEKERELEEILPYFPILRDLLDEVRPNCRCPRCRSGDSQDESLLQPGCLRRVAFQEVLFLIAHAVADGFGCEDVSGSTKSDPVIEATTVLLLELCEGKKVLWDTWFSAAACVYLGCEFRHHVMDIENSGTTYAAIQCGNLSVLARWFNLTAALKVQGCFGLIQGKGTIGVLRPQAQDPDLFQFRGVEEEFAIIQTEHTEDTSSFVDRFPKTPLEAGETVELAPDSSTVRSDVFLVSASTNVYRFLFRVQSNSHNRVIDPSDAIIRVARGLTSYECRHTQQAKLRSGTVRQTSFLYTFDELLGRWSNIEGFYGVDKTGPAMMNVNVDKTLGIAPQPRRLVKMETPTSDAEEGPSQQENADDITTTDEWIHFSSVLTSRLQFNIALALAVNDAAVLNDGTSCFACVQDQVLAVPLPASQQMDEDDTVTRTVINMHPSLVEEAGRSKLKRKAITE